MGQSEPSHSDHMLGRTHKLDDPLAKWPSSLGPLALSILIIHPRRLAMSLTSFIDLTDMPDMATPNCQTDNQQQIPEQSLLTITPTLPAQEPTAAPMQQNPLASSVPVLPISTTSTTGVTSGRKRKSSLEDKDAKTKERYVSYNPPRLILKPLTQT